MSRPAAVPLELRRRAFRGSSAVARGLLTPNQLRSSAWRRFFPDVYADRELELTHRLRARAAAAWVVPGAVVTGRSAAVLWGVDLATAYEDVELTVPPGSHPRRVPGLRVRRAALVADGVRRRAGVPLTDPALTTLRVAAVLAPDEVVAAVDRMVLAGVVGLDELRHAASAARGPGSARARTAVSLADGLAESPQETRVRLLVRRSGLPVPVAQYRVQHQGRFVARVDFAWPDVRVALEYDGLWHAEAAQFARDRDRLNRLQAAGWRVVFVTARNLSDGAAVIRRVSEALALAGVR